MKRFIVLIWAQFGLVLLATGQPCQTGKLDARVAATLHNVLQDLGPPAPATSVEQIRDVKIESPADLPAADVQRVQITADSIRLLLYNPTHSTGLPIIISYHPGGFVTPLLPFMEYEYWRQANTYRALVVGVDYRVAPQHPYPAAVADAYRAFEWVLQHGPAYGGDTSRIMVLGLSAGGNLAAVVCQKAKREGLSNKIKLQVLNCPSTDHPGNQARHPSYQQYATGYFNTKAFCEYAFSVYAPNTHATNPEIAPLQGKDLSGLPPALVITAEFDPLRDEGYAYAERLRKAGVKRWYHCFPGQIHCLVGLPPEAKELKQVDQLIKRAMQEAFNP